MVVIEMKKRFFEKFLFKNGIWVLIFASGAIYSFYGIVRHLRFESLSYDLGIYDQMIWLVSHGKPLYSSLMDMPFWADHFNPSLILLAPLYWLWDKVIILLLFQAFFACFGALPIWLLARKKTKDELFSLVIALAYVCFFGLQNALTYDFHPIVLAATLLAWLFYFYETKKDWFFWPILIVLLGLQENFALLTIALGLYLVVRYRDIRRGIFISVLGGVWFLMAVFIIIPYFGKAEFIYLPTYLTRINPLEMLKMLFYPWMKIKVMIASLLSFGFLPFFSPAIFLILFEEFFQRFVGSPFQARWCVGYQYNVILGPVLALGAIEGFKKFLSKRRYLAIAIILLGVILTQKYTSPATGKLLTREFYDFAKVKETQAILSLIPKEASVAASNFLGPHLAHREKIILLTNCLEDKIVWEDQTKRCFSIEPDYLVADLDPNLDPLGFYPDYSQEKISRYFDYLVQTGQFELIKQQGTLVLFKRIE